MEWSVGVLEGWQSNLLWTIIGSIIIAIPVGILINNFMAKRQILAYRITSTTLTTRKMSKIHGIQITLNGVSVDSLVSTTVMFINYGNKSIESGDFRSPTPLCLSIQDGQFLDGLHGCEIIMESKNVNTKLAMSDDKQTLRIHFDWLKPRETILVTVLHDGTLSVSGELKSGAIKNISGQHKTKITVLFSILTSNSISMIGFILAYAFGLIIDYQAKNNLLIPYPMRLLEMTLLCIGLIPIVAKVAEIIIEIPKTIVRDIREKIQQYDDSDK